jgi:hypothetical protein
LLRVLTEIEDLQSPLTERRTIAGHQPTPVRTAGGQHLHHGLDRRRRRAPLVESYLSADPTHKLEKQSAVT